MAIDGFWYIGSYHVVLFSNCEKEKCWIAGEKKLPCFCSDKVAMYLCSNMGKKWDVVMQKLPCSYELTGVLCWCVLDFQTMVYLICHVGST